MPVEISKIDNLQNLEIIINGPGDARRMFVITGVANTSISVEGGPEHTVQTSEVFVAKLGPALTRTQFVRAIATASITGVTQKSGAEGWQTEYKLRNVDADYDDESGQVQLELEIRLFASRDLASVSVDEISFQLTILATE